MQFCDNAHDFELEILKNLDAHGNSTNDTGHDYVEVLKITLQIKALLLIKNSALLHLMQSLSVLSLIGLTKFQLNMIIDEIH